MGNDKKKYTKPVPQELPMAVVSNCDKVRLRTKPDARKNNNVLAILDAGTKVELLDASNPDWSRVAFGDKRGWIMSEYLLPV